MIELTKEYIVSLIERQGMTKADFASQMGYARQNLDVMLSSKKKDIATVVRMSEILNIPLLEFIGEESSTQPLYGCLYVNGIPTLINNREDVEALLKTLD